MLYYNSPGYDPRYNLALEEYLMKDYASGEDVVMLWQGRPSVLIGRHQNTLEEVDPEYIRENGLLVVRRVTGGGAVYQDMGNVNFSYIIRQGSGSLYDFRRFTAPVIEALAAMGAHAEFNSRNDITIDGKKISGNAQYIYKNTVLHHGTLLFNSDLVALSKALRVQPDKISSKGIRSVLSRVTNIAGHLPQRAEIGEFKERLLASLIKGAPAASGLVLSTEDRRRVSEFVRDKYATWEWNYGESPDFNLKSEKRLPGGKVEIRLFVKRGGTIGSIRFYGDFLGGEDMAPIEGRFSGEPYNLDSIRGILAGIDVPRYFGVITAEELLSCFVDL